MKYWGLLGLLITWAGVSYSDPIPVPVIAEGVYTTDGASRFKNGEIAFRRLGDEFVMAADLVQGPHTFKVVTRFVRTEHNHFAGSGTITVRYPEGTQCVHRMGARVNAYEGHLFYRENTPATIPYNPNGPCTAAGPYIWASHPEPYVK